MRNQFSVDLNQLADTILVRSQKSYRLADVQDRIEKVAYDLVRFRDNDDTSQLWKIQDSPEGPVIVALYNDEGLQVESDNDWEAIPNKSAMNIFYKGEPIVSLSSQDLGIPAEEFNILSRWLPSKLANDSGLQVEILSKVAASTRRIVAQRFPELAKVAMCGISHEDDNKADEYSPFPMENDVVETLAEKIKEELEPQEIEHLIELLKAELV